ncbi:MAG: RAD55 family ATPase [Candidatus Altiarchaeota archaeon]|nr:RAD55 family ATPase [Candidatus Altiarchaeota archaeon]
MEEERLPTGVKELDDMLGGGVYRGVNILLKGGPGTGKTTLALQYIIQGARLGERGMYLTFEESSDQIMRYGKKFFPDIESHIKNDAIRIMDFSPHITAKDSVQIVDGKKVQIPDKESLDSAAYIEDRILDIRGQTIQRVVIDGLQTFATMFCDLSSSHDPEELRRALSRILLMLKKEGITTYILSEETEHQGDKYSFVNFGVDGSILLAFNEALDMRTMKIIQLRGIQHTLRPISVQFIPGTGVVVSESQKHRV